jgi:hypothetical protein
MTPESQLAAATLDLLHGARSLPPADAAAELRDFLNSINTSIPDSPSLSNASGALSTLVGKLETSGSATNDDWEHAIETMLSLANESG